MMSCRYGATFILSCLLLTYSTTAFLAEEDDYSEEFFACHERNRPVYQVLAKTMHRAVPVQQLASGMVRSVLDVGCGSGFLVEAWRTETPLESYCVEGSPNAQKQWPDEYKEKYYQLLDLKGGKMARDYLPQTEIVTSFEVAEHLPPSHADDFVQLLVHHKPLMVFFGAATPNQDQGKNPSHVNENTFAYWIDKFRQNGYIIDMVRTAMYRHQLLTDSTYRQHFHSAWWYAKNALVFVPAAAQPDIDRLLVAHPKEANMMAEEYLNIANGDVSSLWKRDWTEFANLFYQEQARARARNMLLEYHSNVER